MSYALFLAAVIFSVNPASSARGTSVDSVHRLPPSAFPTLPAGIRHDLELRGCLVPQPWDGGTPQNVIRGAFSAANADEWAILCSIREDSQILIYRSPTTGAALVIDSLQRSPDREWLQGIGGGRWGYSRLIRLRTRRQIRGWRVSVDGQPIPQPIDHDAIEQLFEDKGAEAFYFARGVWYRRLTGD